MFHARRFPGAAESAARVFAAAAVRLAAIKPGAPAVNTVAGGTARLINLYEGIIASRSHDASNLGRGAIGSAAVL